MLREYWYPALASRRLSRKPVASRVLDRELVLFRDDAGTPHALLDRCCHRGMALSQGRVVDGVLECRYHGWRFDGNGRCVQIPSLLPEQRIPAGAVVPGRVCQEGDGYLWVWMGESEDKAGPLPRLPDVERGIWIQGSRNLEASTLTALENSLDIAHVPFVHRWSHPYFYTVRRHGLREQSFETRVTQNGMLMFAPPTERAEAPVPDTGLRVEFELPSRMTVRLGLRFANRIIQQYVPTGPSTCRMEYLLRLTDRGHRTLGVGGEGAVPRQDREAVESVQAAQDRYGDEFERSVEADAPTLLLRRILALAEEGRWETEHARIARRVVSARV